MNEEKTNCKTCSIAYTKRKESITTRSKKKKNTTLSLLIRKKIFQSKETTMQKESLIKIRKAIIDLVVELESIPKEDRFEICINENQFLDPEKYEKT